MHNFTLIVNTLLQSIWPYALDTSFSDISLKSLFLAKGVAYVQQVRDTQQNTLTLPRVQFEIAQRAEQLPKELQHRLKNNYLDTDLLRTRWAQSYVAYKLLQDTIERPEPCHNPAGRNLAYAPSGELAATYPHHTSILLWHPEKSTQPLGAMTASSSHDCIAWAGKNSVVSGHSDTLSLWDVETQKQTAQTQFADFQQILKIVPHTEKQLFSVAMHTSLRKKILCWRPQDNSWVEFASKSIYEAHSVTLSCSPDGTTCAIGNTNGGIELWDTRKEQCFATCVYAGATDINNVEFLSPTLVAATSSRYPVLNVYDVTTQERVRSFCEKNAFIYTMCRIDDTKLGTVSYSHSSGAGGLRIFDIKRNGVSAIPGTSMSAWSAIDKPLVCGPHALLATSGNTADEIVIYRPTLPSVPDNVDEIPFSAYALAANG